MSNSNPEYWTANRICVSGTGPEGPFTVDVGKPFALIGAHSKADIVLTGEGIARRHLYAHLADGGIFVIDLAKCRRRKQLAGGWVTPGQNLKVGSYRLSFGLTDGKLPAERGDTNLLSSRSGRPPFPSVHCTSDDSPVGQRLLTRRLTVVGRGKTCILRFTTRSMSVEHCMIYMQDGTLWVIDLKTSNKTRVDGQPIECDRLGNNSTVTLGRVKLKLEWPVDGIDEELSLSHDELADDDSDIGLDSAESFGSDIVGSNLHSEGLANEFAGQKSLADDKYAKRQEEWNQQELVLLQRILEFEEKQQQLETTTETALEREKARLAELEDCRAEIASQKLEIETANAKLQEATETAQAQIDELVEQHSAEIIRLQESIEDAKQKSQDQSDLGEHLEKAREQLTSRTQELEDERLEKERLQNELEKFEAEISRQKLEIESANAKLQEATETAQAQIDELVEQHSAEIISLQESIEDAKQKSQDQSDLGEHLEKAREQLTSRTQELEAERLEKERLQNELEKFEAEISRQKLEIESAAKSQRKSAETFQQKIDSLTELHSSQVSMLEEALKDSGTQVQDQAALMEKLQDERDQLASQIQKLEKDCLELERLNSEREEEWAQIAEAHQQKLSELEVQLANRLNEQQENERESQANLSNRRKELDDQLKSLEEERATWQKQQADIDKMKAQLTEQQDSLEVEIKERRDAIATAEKAIDEAKEKLFAEQKEFERFVSVDAAQRKVLANLNELQKEKSVLFRIFKRLSSPFRKSK